MILRKSNKNDIEDIMKIICEAQNYFKEQGIDQWQNNYPNYYTIEDDINKGESYVLVSSNKIIATTAISFAGEITYSKIYEGQWINNDEFAVIHRIAVDNHNKGVGVASEMLKCVEKICKSKGVSNIKVDTHKDNKSMQRLLSKKGYKYCGIIYLLDGNERIAFQKVIK